MAKSTLEISLEILKKDPKDYYGILNLPKNVDANEIRKKYINITKDLHPSQYEKNSEEKFSATKAFVLIENAYQTLSDPHKKNRYDEELKYIALLKNILPMEEYGLILLPLKKSVFKNILEIKLQENNSHKTSIPLILRDLLIKKCIEEYNYESNKEIITLANADLTKLNLYPQTKQPLLTLKELTESEDPEPLFGFEKTLPTHINFKKQTNEKYSFRPKYLKNIDNELKKFHENNKTQFARYIIAIQIDGLIKTILKNADVLSKNNRSKGLENLQKKILVLKKNYGKLFGIDAEAVKKSNNKHEEEEIKKTEKAQRI